MEYGLGFVVLIFFIVFEHIAKCQFELGEYIAFKANFYKNNLILIISELHLIVKEVGLDLCKESSEILMIVIIQSKLIYLVRFIRNFLNLADTNKFLFELLNLFDELGGYIAIIS